MKKITFILFLFAVSVSFSQTIQQVKKITKNYNVEKLQSLSDELAKKYTIEKEEADQLANENNWPISYIKDGSYYELRKMSDEGKPIYYKTYNKNAAKSTRANHLHNGGNLGLNLEGQNMVAYVWDGGIARATHKEYDGIGGDNRFIEGESKNLSDHAGHVMGTIIASGYNINAKGMAPQATGIGYKWDNDQAEVILEATYNGMLISNHSYGPDIEDVSDWTIGAYTNEAKQWDQILYDAPYYLMVVAGGNDGDNNSANGDPLDGNSSYDKMTSHTTAKNNMVVASGQDANIGANGEFISVYIDSFSSEGPTDDYRIKPDITGNGDQVFSCTTASDHSYEQFWGTSMASPNIAGSMLLLQQHYYNANGTFMRASTLKGLVLCTADDAGLNGPDAKYGWGLMNSRAAAKAISENGLQSLIIEETLNEGETYTVTVISDNINPLLASISWTDVPGEANTGTANDHTPVLVNDLDIRVTKGTTYMPWKLTGVTSNTKGDNIVDPFERVDVSGASGVYTITVTHKGTLENGHQDFALIVTGLNSDFTFDTDVSEMEKCDSSSAIYNFDFITSSGSTSNTTFSADNIPSGANVSFSPTALNSDGPFTMSITDLSNVTPGEYTIDVTATNSSESETKSVKLSVYNSDFTSPALLSPENNSIYMPISYDFSWSDDEFNNQSFEIQIAEDAGFSNIVKTDTVDDGIYHSFELEDDTTYYWRVRPINICSTGPFSAASSFTTSPCSTYSYSGSPVDIPDIASQSANIPLNVTESFVVKDVNVYVEIMHDDVSQLLLNLIAPDGSNVYLKINDVDCLNPSNMMVGFDDRASTTLTCGTNPNYNYFGNFKPRYPLANINDVASVGEWKLQVRDTETGISGSIIDWSLNICDQAYSGIDETQIEDFSIWPNPSNGNINISFNLTQDNNVKIGLFDVAGRLIKEKTFINKTSEFNENINFGVIKSGFYIVKIENGNRFITKKILINK